jgi:hypothetical protein
MFRCFSPNLSICVPTETRFATNFLMIDHLRLLRNALVRMIIDDDWPPFLADLRRRSARTHEVGMHVRATIRSNGFWYSYEIFLYMVIPVVNRVVTLDVFRENHVRRMSSGHVRTSLRPDERPSRPTACGWPLADGPSGQPKQTAAWGTAQADGRLADGPGGRPVLR